MKQMNGFEKHGLTYTSASQINMFEESPAAWVARYLYGKKFAFGVAAQVGVLTEKVVEEVLMGSEFDPALERAKVQFGKNNAMVTDEKALGRINDIEPMALNALEVLKPYGEPEFIEKLSGREQQKIEINCNGAGWTLPVIGYLDFVYPQHGLVVDLKTTLRIPSTLTGSHARQAAIYRAAKGNMGVKFVYVSPKKSNVLDLEDYIGPLNEVKNILNRQELMLRHFDKEQMADIAPINLGSFYWNDSTGKEIRQELYNV